MIADGPLFSPLTGKMENEKAEMGMGDTTNDEVHNVLHNVTLSLQWNS